MKTNWKTEWKPLVLIAGLFLAFFYLPVGAPRFDNAVTDAFELVKWYAHERVIVCLIPAFFIAGAIGVFVSQASVMKYPGQKANKVLAYGVASVSGTILAVCSCTVLHLVGAIPLSFSGPGPVGTKRKGYLAALILGLVFGIALGSCSFAYLAPMLGVTFKLAASNFLYGALLLLSYGVGHCSVIVAAGMSTKLVQRFLNWNEQSNGLAVLNISCGILVILGGVWLIYSAP